MKRQFAVVILLQCLVGVGLSNSLAWGDDKDGPQNGWYIAAPERDGAPSLVLKIEKRGAVYGVSGVFGNPARTRAQAPLGGTYYPSKNKLAGTWTQSFRSSTGAIKTQKLPLDGKYDAGKDAFDVKVRVITQVGPGLVEFHCVRSKTKEKATSLTGTWRVASEGWTLRLTQTNDKVAGTYSGSGGVSGSISTKLTGNSLAGSYTHRQDGDTYQGTIRATLTDPDTIVGVWTEKKHGFSQEVTATRVR